MKSKPYDKIAFPWIKSAIKRLNALFPSLHFPGENLLIEDLVIERLAGREEHISHFFLTSHSYLVERACIQGYSVSVAEWLADHGCEAVLEEVLTECEVRFRQGPSGINTQNSAVYQMQLPVARALNHLWRKGEFKVQQPLEADDPESGWDDEVELHGKETTHGSHQMARDPLEILIRRESYARFWEVATAEAKQNERFAIYLLMTLTSPCTYDQIDQTWRPREQDLTLWQALCVFDFYYFAENAAHWSKKSARPRPEVAEARRNAMIRCFHAGRPAPTTQQVRDAMAKVSEVALIWDQLLLEFSPKAAFRVLAEQHLELTSEQAKRVIGKRGKSVTDEKGVLGHGLQPFEDEGGFGGIFD